jgi:DNA gyrase subunit B
VERGHIYIAQPPLYKVKQGKTEQYLKDDHELNQYLLGLALQGSEIRSGECIVSTEALGSIAREYLLAEAVIRRIARILPKEVLEVLLEIPDVTVATEQDAESAAQRLNAILLLRQEGENHAAITLQHERDDLTGNFRLRILKTDHGVVHASFLDSEFLTSGDYERIKAVAHLFQGLVKEGAMVRRGEKGIPIKSFPEALRWLLEEARKGVALQRYKGLGEMNPDQLWETTMNPESRRLLRVQIEDAIRADEIFTTLMGDEVEPRRQFIENNALGVTNIDI